MALCWLKYLSLERVNRISPRAARLSLRNKEKGGMGEGREVHGGGRRKRKRGAGTQRLRESFFQVLRAAQVRFCLRLWRVRRRGGRHYPPMIVTVPTALTIHVFKVKKASVAFYKFGGALFGLSVFHAYQLYFQVLRKFFRPVSPIFLFHSCTGRQRARPLELGSLPPPPPPDCIIRGKMAGRRPEQGHHELNKKERPQRRGLDHLGKCGLTPRAGPSRADQAA